MSCRMPAARMRSTRATLELQLAGDLLGVAPDRLRVARGGDVAQVERLGQQHRGGELLGAGALGVAERLEHLERLGVVDDAAVTPEPLGGIERAVGGTHERGGVASLGPTARDADRHRNGDREGRELAADEHSHVLGDSERPGVVGAREHERELLAAESRRHVAGAGGGAQHVGEAPQHVIARVVAERVVDALEVVEVEHEQRQLAGEPSASRWASIPGSKSRRLRRPVNGSWAARWRSPSSWRADSIALMAWFANARSAWSYSSEGSMQSSGSSTHTIPASRPSRSSNGTTSQSWIQPRGPRPLSTEE